MQKILYVKVLVTSNLIKENKCFSFSLHLNCISLYSSTYNSIRYRRFFDIIEYMCRFIIKLQIKSLLIYFKS